MISWWKRRKQEKAYAIYINGYDYAAGALLRHFPDTCALEDYLLDRTYSSYGLNNFGVGIRDALLKWEQLKE